MWPGVNRPPPGSLPEPARPIGPQPDRWIRFLAVSIAFLVYESILIVGFGERFYVGPSSEAGAWLMFTLAILGYFALGACSGSYVSIFVFPLPILITLATGGEPPVDALGGEPLPLWLGWIFWSIFFLPAWVLGTVLALARDIFRRRRSQE